MMLILNVILAQTGASPTNPAVFATVAAGSRHQPGIGKEIELHLAKQQIAFGPHAKLGGQYNKYSMSP
jgi:hypothetical protein